MKNLIRRALLGSLLAFAPLTVIGAPAHALSASTGLVAVEAAAPAVIVALDLPQFLNLLIAVVFPVLVGLVTTKVTKGHWKALLLATISLFSGLASALLTAVLAGVSFDVIGALLTGIAAWIIAIATHYGFWRPTGVTDKVQAVGVTPTGGV